MPYNCEQIAMRHSHSSKAAVVEPAIDDRLPLLKRVQEILGVDQLRSDQELVARVEQGLSTKTLDGLRRCGLNDDELYTLVVPRRTLTHRRARRESLSREESDRVVRIARIAALAEHVFGEHERAWKWLRASQRQFRSRNPVQMLSTEAGARLVEELLYRIDEGMAA